MKSKETPFSFRVMDAGKWVFGFALWASLVPLESGAQDYLKKEVYLKAGPARLDSVLLTITRQTGVVFSYNSKKIDARQKINVSGNTKSLGHFLDILRMEKGLAIKSIENYVVLSLPDDHRLPNSTLPSVATTNGASDLKKVPLAKPKPAVIANSVSPAEDPVPVVSKADNVSSLVQEIEIQPVNKKWQTVTMEARRDQLGKIEAGIENHFKSPVITAVAQKSQDNVGSVATSRTPKVKSRFSLVPGLTVDESSFMGLTLQAGLPSVYATVSGNTNLLASHIRYGVGTSIKLTSKVRLQATANTGDLVRSGHFTDSLGNSFPIAIKSNLLRFGVGAEWSAGNKLRLQVIPIFNWLTTRYFINQVPADLHLFNSEGDHLFYDITAPYFITNTFSPTSSENVKTWIGLQVNLLYRINFKWK